MRRTGLQRFVSLAPQRERNLALTVELEAAIIELSLQEHIAKHLPQLVVAESVSLELRRLDHFGHRTSLPVGNP